MPASTVSKPAQEPKSLHVTLWVVQAAMAVAFALFGSMKLTAPLSELAETMAFVSDVPGALVRFIGGAELAGAAGLILPALTRIRPGLTTLAALGLLTTMVLAVGFHIVRGEVDAVAMPVVLGGLAAFVAWGRHGKASIPKRIVHPSATALRPSR